MDKKVLFALDIGTRSVFGIVGEQLGNKIELKATERLEHHTRAMLDGQIHDVPEVAAILAEVKGKLEETCGTLQKVSVAAAGRALCTMRGTAQIEAYGRGILTAADEHALELAAIQTAQHQLATSGTLTDPTAYYCVGYSVVHFTLDDTPLKTLVGQRGKQAGIELIATFLPRQVIDSLQSAIKEVGLEIETLTLEPIAAINVLIPPTMRHLNLALVDVGAGTSDVALTRDGAVIGYGMVPCAGDEITEAISQKYLLDFNVAETLKRQLNGPKTKKVSFKDILGSTHKLSAEEITACIAPTVADLAQSIASQIVALNNEPPQAVLLVGGGALTPMLPEAVAQALDIPAARVAIRCPETIDGIPSIPSSLRCPDAVTPLGILKLSAGRTLNFINVTLNDQPLHLFNLGQLSVADALLAGGIDIRSLHGRPGMGMTVTVNGKTQFFPGTHGKPGQVLLNDAQVPLNHPINEDDVLVVEKGVTGEAPCVKLSDILQPPSPLVVKLNGQPRQILPTLTINGQPATAETCLADRDQVVCQLPATLESVLAGCNEIAVANQFVYQINGNERIYRIWPEYTINGQPAQPEDAVKQGDAITVALPTEPTLQELLGLHKDECETITVQCDGRPCVLPLRRCQLQLNGKPAKPEDIAPDGSQIDVQYSEQGQPMVSDVLLAANFQPQLLPLGSKVDLLLNKQRAEYTALVKNGDILEIVVTPFEAN